MEHIAFAKIVATPTPSLWSQAYHAGKLFAILCLSHAEETRDDDFLSLLGKEVFNALEEEFFTLEEKDFTAIKKAVTIACKKLPEDITASLMVASIQKNTLYAFILGQGSILLKRGDKVGTLLTSEEALTGVSGILYHDDIVIVQTQAFDTLVPLQELTPLLTPFSPTDITEALAAKVHGTQEGQATAILLHYTGPDEAPQTTTPTTVEDDAPLQDEPEEEENQTVLIHQTIAERQHASLPLGKINTFLQKGLTHFKFGFPRGGMSHKKKLYLGIALVLLIVLVFSITSTLHQREQAKQKAQFEALYAPAAKKYDEGQGLIALNKNLARENFQEARTLLTKDNITFPTGSEEEKKRQELLTNIDTALKDALDATNVTPKRIDKTSSGLLEEQKKNKSAILAQDTSFLYLATDTTISSIDKGNKKTKKLIDNKDTWGKAGGLGVYIGNLYLVDTSKKTISKFVATNSGFNTSNYLTAESPLDLSKAVSLAIDGSLYILLSDGTVGKFTRGKAETFTLSGFDTPLKSPKQISTTVDGDLIYILDPSNSRVVTINKQGEYQAQYQAEELKKATAFDIVEKDHLIYFLTDEGLFSFSTQ